MISKIPCDERPRERCLRLGAEALSLRECLAVLIGSGPKGKGCLGLAQEILDFPGSGMSEKESENAFFSSVHSSHATLDFAQGVRGFGVASRARVLAALEIARRYREYLDALNENANDKETQGSLEKMAVSAIPTRFKASAKEWLGFVPVYSAVKIGEFCLVENGVRTHVNTDALEIFARLLPLRPAAFFLFHNHPSGNLEASKADCELTASVADLASRFGIGLLAHGIVNRRRVGWID